MKVIWLITRMIVGVLFIFSGLVKADDPLGLSYKMQEFFELWNWQFLDHLALAFSMLMIVFEVLAGVALLLGWKMNLFSWLLLALILFFCFLTGYAFLSGRVRECGCFGDCIPLSSGASFAKDIGLLLLILFLFPARKRIRPALNGKVCAVILSLTVVFTFSLQWFVMQHLPIVDCLAYRRGVNIQQAMKAPPGARPDSSVITLVYQHQGTTVEFTSDKFPADFNDSYHFVKRYDRLVRKGNDQPSIRDFVLLSAEGGDSTEAILDRKGYKIFLFTWGISERRPDWVKPFSILFGLAKAKQVPVFVISNDYESAAAWATVEGINKDLTLLKCDATAVKTAARANPTIYLIKGSTILEKWGFADFENALPDLSALPEQ